MWYLSRVSIVCLLALTTCTYAEEKRLKPSATNYGVPDYRQTRSLGVDNDYSNDLVGLSTDLSGLSSDLGALSTSYSHAASGLDDSLSGLSANNEISSNANAYATALNGFTNYGGDLNALQSVQQIPIYSPLQQFQQFEQVPVISSLQSIQQVPVISSVQQPVIVQQPALGVEGRSLGSAGVAALGGGLAGAGIAGGIGGGVAAAGAGFGGGFKRYRTSIHIRSRGFGGGLGGFGGIGGLGGFKGIGGGFGGGHYKARYAESSGGGFAGAGGVAGGFLS